MSGFISSFIFSRSQLIDTLTSHFHNYSICIHNHFFKQIQGIPQGSILSVPLCNLYLRSYEQTVLIPSIRHQISFEQIGTPLTVLRFVDDFLFLTPHPKLYQSLTEILFPSKLVSLALSNHNNIVSFSHFRVFFSTMVWFYNKSSLH